jgi:hypothetical protein
MKIQLNLNDLHAKLSLTLRFTIATIIFFIALLLRLTIWPAEFGLTFITFYPAHFYPFIFAEPSQDFL